MALIPDHLTAKLQVSVSSLHAQGQLAHEAVNADLQGRAAAPSSVGRTTEAALLHQPAEAAATVLPSQPQCDAEPRQPLRPGASLMAGASHSLQMAGAAVLASCLTAGPEVTSLVLGHCSLHSACNLNMTSPQLCMLTPLLPSCSCTQGS